MNNLAGFYSDLGRLVEAESLFVETIKLKRSVLGEQHSSYLFSRMGLAEVYYKQGEFEQARSLQEDAVALSRSVWSADSWFTDMFQAHHGVTLIDLEQNEAAEAALLEAHEILTATRGADFEMTISATKSLVKLYDAWDKPQKSAAWRSKLPPEEGG